MKHLKTFESIFNDFWDRDEIESICRKYNIENYTINKDGSIDVDGNVELCERRLTKLPIRFRNVTGHFQCWRNELTDLKGSPVSVGGNFSCYSNRLVNLIDGPEYVDGDYYCNHNRLMSLYGSPESVRNFSCQNNQLKTLNGCPESVSGSFYCMDNQLKTFEGASRTIGGYVTFLNNPINEIYKLFNDYSKIELFNDYDIIQDDKVIIERLNDFLMEIRKPTVKKVDGYINI